MSNIARSISSGTTSYGSIGDDVPAGVITLEQLSHTSIWLFELPMYFAVWG